MSSSRTPKPSGQRRAAPAAGLLAGPKAPEVVDVVDEPRSVVGAPLVSQVSLEEHQRLQREHREWLAKMAQETPAQALSDGAGDVQDDEDVVALPTPQERAERAAQEALGYYLACLTEMPADEPRYVVGPRRRQLLFGDYQMTSGDIVPGAAHWPRLDSWLRAGYIVAESAYVRTAS